MVDEFLSDGFTGAADCITKKQTLHILRNDVGYSIHIHSFLHYCYYYLDQFLRVMSQHDVPSVQWMLV
jgi:hypothetical protein